MGLGPDLGAGFPLAGICGMLGSPALSSPTTASTLAGGEEKGGVGEKILLREPCQSSGVRYPRCVFRE